jgi:hypothetical protein
MYEYLSKKWPYLHMRFKDLISLFGTFVQFDAENSTISSIETCDIIHYTDPVNINPREFYVHRPVYILSLSVMLASEL